MELSKSLDAELPAGLVRAADAKAIAPETPGTKKKRRGQAAFSRAIDFPRASEETTGPFRRVEPMSNSQLQALIERAFEDRAAIGAGTQGEVREAVEKALELARPR